MTIAGFYVIRESSTIELCHVDLLILILGLFLLAVAVTMVLRALFTARRASTETIEQIGAYGFAGALPEPTSEPGRAVRAPGRRSRDSVGALDRRALHAG